MLGVAESGRYGRHLSTKYASRGRLGRGLHAKCTLLTTVGDTALVRNRFTPRLAGFSSDLRNGDTPGSRRAYIREEYGSGREWELCGTAENVEERAGTTIDENEYFSEGAERHLDENEGFILGDFVKVAYLGKPMGVAWDPMIEIVVNRVLRYGRTRNTSKLEVVLDDCIDEFPVLGENKKARGRFIWRLLRHRGAIRQPPSDTIWVVTYVLWHLNKRFDSPGYVWGVFINALNRCELPIEAENAYQIAKSLSLEDSRFSSDATLIHSARLYGTIQAFIYHAVPTVMEEMKNVCGMELTGWAFNRTVHRSTLLHLKQIHHLPHWNGTKDRDYKLPIKLEHYVSIIADIGQITRARQAWVDEYVKRVNKNESMNLLHVELQHLVLGIQIFARAPHLYPPYDKIIRMMVERIKLLLRQKPDDAIHMYGLINHLCRARMIDYAEELAYFLMQHGTLREFISPIIHYHSLVGDREKQQYWLKARGPPRNGHIRAFDEHNSILIEAHFQELIDLLGIIRHYNRTLPLQYIVNIQLTLAKRVHATENTITIEDYRQFVNNMLDIENLGHADIYHQQKYILDLIIPGHYREAEEFVFSPFRTFTKKNDIMLGFLVYFYATNNMHQHLLRFLERARHIFRVHTLFYLVGMEKSIFIFQALKDAPDTALCAWPSFSCRVAARTEMFSIILDAAIANDEPEQVEELWNIANLSRDYENTTKIVGSLGRAIEFLKQFEQFSNLAGRMSHVQHLLREKHQKLARTK